MDTFSEETVSRRRWLTERVLIHAAERGIPMPWWIAVEAVASTAIEHPEWDMDERRTREEWGRGKKVEEQD